MMLQGYGLLWVNWLDYVVWQSCQLWQGLGWGTLRNLALLILGLPLVLLIMNLHWCFLLLDELLFYRYRRLTVAKPVFILGVPRSGTTFLQRTLSGDPQFTTTTLQECLFTPAISQRYLASGLAWLFQPLVRMFKGWFVAKQSQFRRQMESIHPLGLDQAEEDFLLLLPALACFIQMVVFPGHQKTWQLAHFDSQVGPWRRKVIMNLYYRQVQRHMYFHGQDKVYLAKNPSFTSLIGSLKSAFPDAVIVACVRDPKQAVPSQIRSLEPAFDVLGHDLTAPEFQSHVLAMLAHYYHEVERWSQRAGTVLVVDMNELTGELFACLQSLYRNAEITMAPDIEQLYQRASEKNKTFRSQYAASDRYNDCYQANAFQHLWPLSGSSRLLSSIENVS